MSTTTDPEIAFVRLQELQIHIADLIHVMRYNASIRHSNNLKRGWDLRVILCTIDYNHFEDLIRPYLLEFEAGYTYHYIGGLVHEYRIHLL
jgi:hypothetical protein